MDASTITKPTVYPFLRYADAVKALDWLVSAFAFEKAFVVPGENGSIAHAQMRLGNGMVMVGSARDDDLGMKSPRELGAVTQGIYVVVEDVDAHFVRAATAGAEILYAPRDTEYGSREYGARDLEGHLWSFGDYLP